MYRRRFEDWRQALAAAAAYIGEARAAELGRMAARLEGRADAAPAQFNDSMNKSPKYVVLYLHENPVDWKAGGWCDYLHENPVDWKAGGWCDLYYSLPDTWDVSPDEWRLGRV